MAEFLTAIGQILTEVWVWFAAAATALIGNEIFIIAVAVLMLSVLIAIIVSLLNLIRFKSPTRTRKA